MEHFILLYTMGSRIIATPDKSSHTVIEISFILHVKVILLMIWPNSIPFLSYFVQYPGKDDSYKTDYKI